MNTAAMGPGTSGPRRILLTGGTGFLGIHLLRALMQADAEASFTVLSRARPKKVLDRLGRFLVGAGAQELADALDTRVTAVRGDLTLPRMGLTEADFDALVGRCDAVWNCAGDIRLDADLDQLRRTNVTGVESVLDFAAACRGTPRLFHVSTAFVAGRRRSGTILPDELDDTFGFENAYEQSKLEGERLVRDWAHRHQRSTMVFRPSILVTDQPTRSGMPVMRHFALARALDSRREALLARRLLPVRAQIRLVGDPGGYLNFLPVELAAQRMVRLSRHEPTELLSTYHVVHEHEVSASTVVEAVRQVVDRVTGVGIILVREPVADPSAWERMLSRLAPGVLTYLSHRRSYDDTSVRALLGEPASGIRINLDYLLAVSRAATPSGVAATPQARLQRRPYSVPR